LRVGRTRGYGCEEALHFLILPIHKMIFHAVLVGVLPGGRMSMCVPGWLMF
jgi:hypothetical protein